MDRLPFHLGGSRDPDVYQESFQQRLIGYGGYFDNQSQQDSFSPFPYYEHHNAFLQQQQLFAQQQFFYQQAAFFGGGRGGAFLSPMQQQAAMQEMMGNTQSHQQRQSQQYLTQLATAQSGRGKRGGGGGGVRGGPTGREGSSAAPTRPSPSSSKPNSSPRMNPNSLLDRELDPFGTHPLRPKINTNVSLNSETSSASSSPFYPPPSTTKRAHGTPIYDFTNPSPTPIADSLRIYGLPPSQDPQRLYGDHREIAVLERSDLVKLLTTWGLKVGSLLGVDALTEQERLDAPHPGAVTLIEAFWQIGGAWDWQDELRTDSVCRSVAAKATMPPMVVKVTFEKWRTLRICIGEGRGGGIGESSEDVEEIITKRRKVEVESLGLKVKEEDELEGEEPAKVKKARSSEEPSSSRPRIASVGWTPSPRGTTSSSPAEDGLLGAGADAMESDDEIEDILVTSTSVYPSPPTSIFKQLSLPSQHIHSHSSTPSSQLDSHHPSTFASNLPQHPFHRSSTSPPKQRLSDLLPLGHTVTETPALSSEDETSRFFSSLVLPVDEAEGSSSSSSSLHSNLASTYNSTPPFAHIRTAIKQSANATNERIRERLDRIRQSSVTSNASASSPPPSSLPAPFVPLADSQSPPQPSSSPSSQQSKPLSPSETASVLPPPQSSRFDAIEPTPAQPPPSIPAVVVAPRQKEPLPSHSSAPIQHTSSIPLQLSSSSSSSSYSISSSTPSRPPPRSDSLQFSAQSSFANSSSTKATTNGFASLPRSSSNNDWGPSDSSRPRPPHLDFPRHPASQHPPQHDPIILNATNGCTIRQLSSSSHSGTPSEVGKEGSERGSVARVVVEQKKVEAETRSLPLGWEAKFSKTKQSTWYYHRPSKATSWTFPSA